MKTEKLNKIIFIILVIVFILFATILFISKGCRHSNNINDKNLVETNYIHIRDTIEKKVIINKPIPYEVIVPKLEEIKVTDTVKILVDYYSERIYEYSYSDSNISFNSDICVRENEIQTICSEYKVFKDNVIIEKKYLTQPKFQLGIGGGISTDFAHVDCELGISVLIKRHRLSVDYGIFDKSVSVGYYYNIISR